MNDHIEVRAISGSELRDLLKEHSQTQMKVEKESHEVYEASREESLRIINDLISHGFDSTSIIGISTFLAARAIFYHGKRGYAQSLKDVGELTERAADVFVYEAMRGEYTGPIYLSDKEKTDQNSTQ